MLQNKHYAQLLLQQGFFDEAFLLYKKLLAKYPNDIEIKESLRKLKKIRLSFKGVNQEKKQFFIEMKSDEEFKEFEEWLIG